MGVVSSKRLTELKEAADRARQAMGRIEPGAVPAPRPAALAPKLPKRGLSMEELVPLAEKARANPASLTVEESLHLLDAGVDPTLVFGPLTPESYESLMRAVERGERLSPEDVIRLRQTPESAVIREAPVEAAAPEVVPEPTGEKRSFSQYGKELADDNDQSIKVRKLGDGEHFVYPDGVVVDVNGNVVGKSAGELTDVSASPSDNLAASAIDIDDAPKYGRGGRDNLTGNKKKVDPTARLAQDIWQITTPTDLESVDQKTVKRLMRDAQKFRNEDGSYAPKFLKQFGNKEAAAGRLAVLEQMAGVSNQQRAAEQIGGAADARAAAGTPRRNQGADAARSIESIDRKIGVPESAAGDTLPSTATSEDLAAARQLAGENLPAGNWDALTSAFNALDDDQRRSVLAALPEGTRSFLTGMMDENAPSPSFLPNKVAVATRPPDEIPSAIPARPAARGDSTTAAEMMDLVRSRLQGQRRMAETVDFDSRLAEARGNKEATDAILAEKAATLAQYDEIMSSPERMAAIAMRELEDSTLSNMVGLDEAAKQAEASGNARAAADYRRRIAATEDRLASAKQSFDAYLAPATPEDPAAEQARAAARVLNDQQSAATALRNALIGQDELVRRESLRNRLSSIPQPQPAAITPGARTPEFQAADVPDAEMPTAYDNAQAVEREAQEALEARAPGGGLSLDQRTDMFGAKSARELPLAFKGRDRNPPFESRSRGERSLEGNDTEAVAKAIGLQESIDAAQKELDTAMQEAKTASGAGALAKATQRVEAARAALDASYRAMDKAYPPRLVNPKTGRVEPASADIANGKVPPPKGWVVERGRPAMSDSRLNTPGQQQTYDEAIVTAVGFRPKPQRNLNRSNADLSAEDVAGMHAEADDVFGDDAAELLNDAGEFDPNWDVNGPIDTSILLEANGAQKKTRLGGTQQPSRSTGAVQTLFGTSRDPRTLTLDGTENGPPAFPELVDQSLDSDAVGEVIRSRSQGVAEDMLRRNSIFKEGTANYEMARDRLASLIESHFAPTKQVTPKATDNAMPTFDGVDDAIRAANEPDNVTGNLDASATEISDGDLAPVDGTAKPAKGRRGKKSSGKQAAAAPADPAAPAAPADIPIQPVTGRAKTVDEVQAEADEIGRAARQQAIDDGIAVGKAVKIGRAARKSHVDTEMAKIAAAKNSGVPPVAGNAQPVGGGAPPAQPPANPPAQPTPAAATASPSSPPPPGSPPAGGGPPSPPSPPAPSPSPPPLPTPTPPKRRGWIKWPLIAGGVVIGAAALDRMGGNSPSDSGNGWGLPPGAGGPPGPIPVGLGAGGAAGDDGATLMDESAIMSERDRVAQALDRLRSARQTGPSQTLIQYNAGWR